MGSHSISGKLEMCSQAGGPCSFMYILWTSNAAQAQRLQSIQAEKYRQMSTETGLLFFPKNTIAKQHKI